MKTILLISLLTTITPSSSFAQSDIEHIKDGYKHKHNGVLTCKRDIEKKYQLSLVEEKPKYAKGFAVFRKNNSSTNNSEKKKNDFKIVTVKTPWPGAEKSYIYLLHQKRNIPQTLCRGIPRIKIPAIRFIAFSTTHLPPLTMLGKQSALKAFAGIKYVSNEIINKMIDDGKVKDVGYPPNPEVLISQKPDLIMAYTTMSPKIDGIEKLLKLGLPVVFNSDYMEKCPLCRAEWIKFMGLFFDEEKKAQKLFQAIEKRYLALKLKVLLSSYRPSIVVGQNNSGIWYAPGGKSDLAKYISDAGGSYLWGGNQSRSMITFNPEAVFSKAKTAQFWLPQNNEWNKLSDITKTDPRYKNLSVIKTGKVYNFNAKISKHGGNDYFETGMMRPDLLISDLIKMFHPSFLPAHKLIWFKLLK